MGGEVARWHCCIHHETAMVESIDWYVISSTVLLSYIILCHVMTCPVIFLRVRSLNYICHISEKKHPGRCTLLSQCLNIFVTLTSYISNPRYRQYWIEHIKTVFPSSIRPINWYIECRSLSEIRDYGPWSRSSCYYSNIPGRWTWNCRICRTMACIDMCLFDIKMRYDRISSFACWIK